MYFIIDEAHRGAQKTTDLARATTIMQKFLKGSPDDYLPAMPVVIGMTATSTRFNRLAEGIQSTTHYVTTFADEVRSSGLLKDRIVITYPETTGNDIAVLQAAADEWKHKWEHWAQYCAEQHYAYVNPIFVIQVQNGNGSRLSNTDLDDCLRNVEERIGERFIEGEVVHAFGEGTSTIQINGLDVHYVEPSRISDDRRIKVVFFKETLSTGWDCPRAETMMSFRHAIDHTYIAQLLGRMVRTPRQSHIDVDDTLNDVHLYLPQFNASTVKDVVDDLQSAEGGNIPTDIYGEEFGSDAFDTLTIRPTYTTPPRQPGQKRNPNVAEGQTSLFEPSGENSSVSKTGNNQDSNNATAVSEDSIVETNSSESSPSAQSATQKVSPEAQTVTRESASVNAVERPNFDREAVVKAINDAGLLTYNVRHVPITDYLKSMYALARFLTQTRIDMDAKEKVISTIVDMMHNHIEALRRNGEYDNLAAQVMQFKMNTQIFDVFGYTIDNYAVHDLLSSTDTDIDRQFRLAELRLGNEGVGNAYGHRFFDIEDPIAHKIDVIIFAANVECMEKLHDFAKDKFHEMNDAYRRRTVTLPERFKKSYDDIVSDGDIISKHNFRLPETIRLTHEIEGQVYTNHLFVDDSGSIIINLNGWERKAIEEEQQQDDFVCWLRNPPKKPWSLCIPYEMSGETRPAYPDFLVIRKDGNNGFIFDILEPHDPSRNDNLGKARGFAEYARQNPGVGRIQLLRMARNALGQERLRRLDMSRSAVRDKVSRCMSSDELDHIFETDGFFM